MTFKLQQGLFSDPFIRQFEPVIGTPGDFPIDGTDRIQLEKLYNITSEYMSRPEQTRKLKEISSIIKGRKTASTNMSTFIKTMKLSNVCLHV